MNSNYLGMCGKKRLSCHPDLLPTLYPACLRDTNAVGPYSLFCTQTNEMLLLWQTHRYNVPSTGLRTRVKSLH